MDKYMSINREFMEKSYENSMKSYSSRLLKEVMVNSEVFIPRKSKIKKKHSYFEKQVCVSWEWNQPEPLQPRKQIS